MFRTGAWTPNEGDAREIKPFAPSLPWRWGPRLSTPFENDIRVGPWLSRPGHVAHSRVHCRWGRYLLFADEVDTLIPMKVGSAQLPAASQRTVQRIFDAAARRVLAEDLDGQPVGTLAIGRDDGALDDGADERPPLGQRQPVPVRRRVQRNGRPLPA